MKKLLPSAVLTLVVFAVAASPSFAGCCFGLFPRCCGCCGCGAKFCVRQYNAFSPVCCGTVFCDGCCPFGACGGYGGYGPGSGGFGGCADGMCPAGGCGMMPFSGLAAPGCGPAGCGDGAYLGSLPAADPMPGVPGAPGAPGTPGAPVEAATPLPPGTTSQMVNDRPIQNAAYSPASYTPPSTATPAPMQPQTMTAPSYWGN